MFWLMDESNYPHPYPRTHHKKYKIKNKLWPLFILWKCYQSVTHQLWDLSLPLFKYFPAFCCHNCCFFDKKVCILSCIILTIWIKKNEFWGYLFTAIFLVIFLQIKIPVKAAKNFHISQLCHTFSVIIRFFFSCCPFYKPSFIDLPTHSI